MKKPILIKIKGAEPYVKLVRFFCVIGLLLCAYMAVKVVDSL